MPWKDSSEYQLFLTCTICRKIRLRGSTCSSFIVFVRLFCVFTLFSFHIVAGRCSFICLWLALLFCDGPLEAPPAASSQCYSLCLRCGEQGGSWGLVAEGRRTIWPVFNSFLTKYSFHANTASHHCHKVHLTMPGETSGAGTFADKIE